MRDHVDVLPLQIRGDHDSLEVQLRGDGTLYLPAAQAVVLADLHLGKAESFQHHGKPVPGGSDRATFERLARAVAETGATEVWILGDLFHEPTALSQERTEALVAMLLAACGVPPVLVRGNHDRKWRRNTNAAGGAVEVVDPPHQRERVTLLHAPAADGERRLSPGTGTALPFLAGHLHPVVRVSAPGERLRLPCFVTSPRGIVLPAFGDFTGGSEMKRGPQRHLVATWEGALIDLG